MNDDEFLAVVEKCRMQRGALAVVREAGRRLEKPPARARVGREAHSGLVKAARLDRAVRQTLQVLDHDELATSNAAHAKALLSALLLATGERAAEHERQKAVGDETLL